jgi:hypothetical protein
MRRGNKGPTRIGSAALLGLGFAPLVWLVAASSEAPAWADSTAYELYCPGTPVGNVVLNDVMVTGSMSPSSPAAGQSFTLSNFQVKANIPAGLASAAQALQNTAVAGTAIVQIDATGATPSSIKSNALSFTSPLPPSGTPVPSSGVNLDVPSPPGSIGPFTASGGPVTLTIDKAATLTLQVSGSPLTLTCTAYPNNTVASGIVQTTPSGSPSSPTVATSSAAAAAASTPTTTVPPSTAASSNLAFTGPSTTLYIVGAAGLLLVDIGYLTLTAVDRPRRLLLKAVSRVGHLGSRRR